MANLPRWHKGDSISSRKLNEMVDAICSVSDDLDVLAASHSSGRVTAESVSSAWGFGSTNVEHIEQYRWTNEVKYRDVGRGTDDLSKNEMPGLYASEPIVAMGDGSVAASFTLSCTSGRNCFVGAESGDLYLRVTTDNQGNPQSAEYTTEFGCQRMFTLSNEEGGQLFFPVAKVAEDTCWAGEEKPLRALNYNTARLPIVADDASFNPTEEEGCPALQSEDGGEEEKEREVQSARFADPLVGNVVPIRGLNNHGGLQFLSCDTDGEVRTSNAVKVNVELYGIVGTPDECQEYGSGTTADGTPVQLYQSDYNDDKPYRKGVDGGLLAKWRFIRDECSCDFQDITLVGGHFDDWQLTFEGNGFVQMPYPKVSECNEGIPVYRQCVTCAEENGVKGYTFKQLEGHHSVCFNQCDELVITPACQWCVTGCTFIPTTPVGSEKVPDERTLFCVYDCCSTCFNRKVLKLGKQTRDLFLD